MYSPELSMALAHRQRRRASTSARKRSLTDGAPHGVSSGPSASGSGRQSISRKSSGFDNEFVEEPQLPPAVKYLEQVALELSVTKKHADVRYVMTVRHSELNAAWRLARSFDEYRKLQQRLLKRLQHGHFCDADCPWLYGFLKSYFPKKLVFTFSSARVVEQRKQTLERFFAALYGFLTDRKNFCCSVVMTVFADELVEFIYGDALKQYGLENPVKSTQLEPEERMALLRMSGGYSSKWDDPATPHKLELIEQEPAPQYSRHSSLTNSFRSSMTDDDIVNDLNSGNCGICGSSLCGVAYGSSTSSTLTPSSSSEEDSNRSVNSSASSTGAAGLPLSRSSSHNDSAVFTPPWLGTRKTSGNSGSANSFGGARRSSSSASRRRASTYYLSTLTCGHQFHDECIVPKLNESLHCPTCGRLQTND
uniref:PX domain-containing protein n=2 Tax=Phytophthora ramorum TaxID=164328 RepID=H3GN57_PHYRM